MTVVEVTEDRLLGGRLRLRQPAVGYRAGMDAALLGAACGGKAGERVLDVGCGAGAALLQAAARAPEARFVGLERDQAAAALARENLALNGMASRAEIQVGDVADGFGALGLERFDAVLCNPPFFDDPGALRPPHPARAGAWMNDAGLEVWTGFMLKAARDGGRIVVVHRVERLADLLTQLGTRAGSFAVRPVHPFAEAPAKRVLVRAIRGGRAPLRLLPALTLHTPDGGHAATAEAILKGEAALDW